MYHKQHVQELVKPATAFFRTQRQQEHPEPARLATVAPMARRAMRLQALMCVVAIAISGEQVCSGLQALGSNLPATKKARLLPPINRALLHAAAISKRDGTSVWAMGGLIRQTRRRRPASCKSTNCRHRCRCCAHLPSRCLGFVVLVRAGLSQAGVAAAAEVAPISVAQLPNDPVGQCSSQAVRAAFAVCRLSGASPSCCNGLDAVFANSSSPAAW